MYTWQTYTSSRSLLLRTTCARHSPRRKSRRKEKKWKRHNKPSLHPTHQPTNTTPTRHLQCSRRQTRTSNDINFSRQFVKGKYTRETMTAATEIHIIIIIIYIYTRRGWGWFTVYGAYIYITTRRVPLPCAQRGVKFIKSLPSLLTERASGSPPFRECCRILKRHKRKPRAVHSTTIRVAYIGFGSLNTCIITVYNIYIIVLLLCVYIHVV